MRRRSLLAAPFILAAPRTARADWEPKQPIKVLVGYAPGGTADIAARIAAETLSKKHGLTVVVENKTGAGGWTGSRSTAVGARACARPAA